MTKFKNCGDKEVSFEIHSIPGAQPQKYTCAPGETVEVPSGYAGMIKRRYPSLCQEKACAHKEVKKEAPKAAPKKDTKKESKKEEPKAPEADTFVKAAKAVEEVAPKKPAKKSRKKAKKD